MTLPPLLCKVKEHPTPQWGQITGVFRVFHGPGLVKAGTLLLLRAPVGQTTTHRPQLSQAAAAGKRPGARIMVSKPRWRKFRALLPWASRQVRTQRPQRIHLFGS